MAKRATAWDQDASDNGAADLPETAFGTASGDDAPALLDGNGAEDVARGTPSAAAAVATDNVPPTSADSSATRAETPSASQEADTGSMAASQPPAPQQSMAGINAAGMAAAPHLLLSHATAFSESDVDAAQDWCVLCSNLLSGAVNEETDMMFSLPPSPCRRPLAAAFSLQTELARAQGEANEQAANRDAYHQSLNVRLHVLPLLEWPTVPVQS